MSEEVFGIKTHGRADGSERTQDRVKEQETS
jgi:hypothetical protein